MRRCPKCRVDFEVVRKTFAEIDVCPQCAGVFLDAGEGIAIHGASADAGFLVKDGRAHLVRPSQLACPSTTHAATTMQIYAIGFGDSAIEFEHCASCGGFFLDHGEGAALEALDREEITTGSGARFSAPPTANAQEVAVDQARAERGRGFFEAFITDVFSSAARGAASVAADLPRRRRHHGFRR